MKWAAFFTAAATITMLSICNRICLSSTPHPCAHTQCTQVQLHQHVTGWNEPFCWFAWPAFHFLHPVMHWPSHAILKGFTGDRFCSPPGWSCGTAAFLLPSVGQMFARFNIYEDINFENLVPIVQPSHQWGEENGTGSSLLTPRGMLTSLPLPFSLKCDASCVCKRAKTGHKYWPQTNVYVMTQFNERVICFSSEEESQEITHRPAKRGRRARVNDPCTKRSFRPPSLQDAGGCQQSTH